MDLEKQPENIRSQKSTATEKLKDVNIEHKLATNDDRRMDFWEQAAEKQAEIIKDGKRMNWWKDVAAQYQAKANKKLLN